MRSTCNKCGEWKWWFQLGRGLCKGCAQKKGNKKSVVKNTRDNCEHCGSTK